MCYKNNSFTLSSVVFKCVQTLLLKRGVPHREDFVHQEDVAVGVDGDSEGQAHLHAAGVVFELLVYEALQLGEAHDVVEFRVNLLACQAEHRRVQIHIVPPGKLWVKADAQLQKRRNPPVDRHTAAVGAVDPGEDFQERTLARAVTPDDAKKLAFFDREAHIVQRLELLVGAIAIESTHKRPTQAANLLVRDAKRLGDVFYCDSDVCVCCVLFDHKYSIVQNLFCAHTQGARDSGRRHFTSSPQWTG